MRATLLILAATLLALPRPGAAQIYRCVHDGQVQYVQAKPRDGQCDKEDVTPQPPIGDAGTATSLEKYSKEIDKERRQEAKEKQAADQQAQRRQQVCSAARRRQAMLDRYGSRQARIDENGQQQYMTDAQYQQERKAVEQAVHDSCG